MRTKLDRRVLHTKLILQGNLLTLLESKPLNRISVTEICRMAEINRNTFYYHYDTVKDILDEMESAMYDLIVEKFKSNANVYAILLEACDILKNNKRIARIVFSDPKSKLINKVVSSYKLLTQKNHKNHTLFTYEENGAIAVLRDWVINDFCEPAESLAEFIASKIQKQDNQFE